MVRRNAQGYDIVPAHRITGAAETGTPILGVFNISNRPLTEIIPLSRLPGILPSGGTYVVRSHSSGRATIPTQTMSASSMITVSLDIRGYDILTAYPLSHFTNNTGAAVLFGNLGLVGKMTGAAAITSSHFSMQENGRVQLVTRLKALGVLGKWPSQDHFLSSTLKLRVRDICVRPPRDVTGG